MYPALHWLSALRRTIPYVCMRDPFWCVSTGALLYPALTATRDNACYRLR